MLTPELFDTLVIIVVILGAAWAGVRLYRDLRRPSPPFGAASSDQVMPIVPPVDPTLTPNPPTKG